LKIAVSTDGKAGLADRRPVAITGEAALRRVHLMRAMNDAVLTGIGTVLSDNPQLTCRLPGMADRTPVRVVLDGRLRMPLASRLVATARVHPVWVVTAHDAAPERAAALAAHGVEIIRVGAAGGRLDLGEALRALAGRGITRVMVEAGPILCAALIAANLVDEAALFRAPMRIGAAGIDALDGVPLTALTQSPGLTSLGHETMDADSVEFFERV
jgi:diaminohydroxyphosphoribosylaminopyrimidine deaminase/5-amino-6-(5-phosphoribosylamino)uracil reductase